MSSEGKYDKKKTIVNSNDIDIKNIYTYIINKVQIEMLNKSLK